MHYSSNKKQMYVIYAALLNYPNIFIISLWEKK